MTDRHSATRGRRPRSIWRILVTTTLVATACGTGVARTADEPVLRLATTTSTDNSGLLDEILPAFEERYRARVDVVAVGTGQAIALGEAGDTDVILVHARNREDDFVAAGHGTQRHDVMYNDFVIVGPDDDPAGIGGMARAADALAAIAGAETVFASRGDDSGTHSKELELWAAAGLDPNSFTDWYKSLGQGMGNALTFADESAAYVLTDRATYISMQSNLPALTVLVGGETIERNPDPTLFNPYGVVPVNPDKGSIAGDLANDFVTWLTSAETQRAISEFGVDAFGQPLFYPDSAAWREENGG